jgi:hypothetical protein
MKKEKPVDTCEHAKKRGHFGYCAACMIRLYRDEAVKRGAIILRQQAKMKQLRKALSRAARSGAHVHVPTCSGNNESYNGPNGPGRCYQCQADLVFLRQIREALKPMKSSRD